MHFSPKSGILQESAFYVHDTNRYLVQGPITLTITNLGGLDCNQQDLRLQPTTNGPLIDDHRLEDKTTNDNQLWSIIETNDP